MDTMSFSAVILLFSLMTFPPHLRGSDCDKSCADKPVFSPSKLVVKHGDPASATCTVCQRECLGQRYDIEHAVGKVEYNQTMLHWKTDSLTEWEPTLTCYYNNASDYQCCTPLPVTVYKPPSKVTFSYGDHTGPVVVDRLYQMRCTIEDAAPFGEVEAVFYQGDRAFGQVYIRDIKDKKPITKYMELDFVPMDYKNGTEYWCEAQFRIESEDQQPLPVVKSQREPTIVYYKPKLVVLNKEHWFTVIEGTKVELDCTCTGNPRPTYNWTLPSGELSTVKTGVFTIEAVYEEHVGDYVCLASNGIGKLKEQFIVDTRPNVWKYIIPAIIGVVALLVIIGVVIYCRHYKHNRTGQYVLEMLRLRPRHAPVPNAE